MKVERLRCFSNKASHLLVNKFGKIINKKSPTNSKRLAVKLRNVAKNAEALVFKAGTNPGGVVNDTVSFMTRNPIASLTVPTPVPTTLVAVPTEIFLKKKVPVYKKLTSTLGNVYDNSFGKVVRPVINGAVHSLKGM